MIDDHMKKKGPDKIFYIRFLKLNMEKKTMRQSIKVVLMLVLSSVVFAEKVATLSPLRKEGRCVKMIKCGGKSAS